MKISSLSRFAFAVCPLAAILAGCGGSQLAVLGATPSSTASAKHGAPARSWIDPTASRGDLVYVSAGKDVDVYSYPGGELVGTIASGFTAATGLCSDASGNVWIINASYFGTSTLVEYAHGGNAPIATLQDPNKNIPEACSVDSLTGNLAVANVNANIAVYANARGSPTYYSTYGFVKEVRTIAYDGSGDLYMRGFRNRKAKAWLPEGSSTVAQFLVRKLGYYDWDGNYLVIDPGGLPATTLTRYKLTGASGTPAGKVLLKSCAEGGVFSIEGSELAVICGSGITYYDYPSGGDPIQTIPGVSAGGVAISVGTAHSSHPHQP
jgi:hypothetical protein